MAKSKVNHRIEKKEIFSIEGFLNIDNLPDDSVVFEVEEEGLVPIEKYLKEFNGELIKLTIMKRDQEDLTE